MRTWYRNLDYLSIFAYMALVGIGLIAIYSTTHGPAAEYLLGSVQRNFYRQMLWFGISVGAFAVILMMPVRFFQKVAYPLYGLVIALLILILFVGTEVSGSRSWLSVGGINIQGAEVAKIGAILAVAQLLSSRRPGVKSFRYGIGSVVLLTLPAVLIIMQNEMGVAIIYLMLVPVMLFWSGLPIGTVLLMISPAVAGYLAIVYMPGAIVFAVIFTLGMLWHSRERYIGLLAGLFTGLTIGSVSFALTSIFKPYQVARIMSFTNPEAEEFRSGVGFHLVQSKAAIGSGGLTGKGFMEGTQTQGAYIPEQSTDFVFTVIAEEWGFIGAIAILLLFALLIVRLIQLGTYVKHPFGSMVAAGVAGIFLIHLIINIGMTLGLLPVIGIPLSFVSYGGSALLSNTILLAIVVNLHMRRDDFSIYGY
ncbi:MAG: rod shape-determining protein RodA [Bacteroidota bacterium]